MKIIDKIASLLKDKKILILGFGREGRVTYEFVKRYVKYKDLGIADKNYINYDPIFRKSENEEYMHNASIHDQFIFIKNNMFITKSNNTKNETTNEDSNTLGV